MGQALGQSFVVENRPGAGRQYRHRLRPRIAPADGYTLLFGSASVTVNATLMPNAGFDLVKDLTPIVLLAGVPNIWWCIPRSREDRGRTDREGAQQTRRDRLCIVGHRDVAASVGGYWSA